MRYLILLLPLVFFSCGPDCTEGLTRCKGQLAQLCADGQWETIMDCTTVDPVGKFACRLDETEDLHTCLPYEQVGGSDVSSEVDAEQPVEEEVSE